MSVPLILTLLAGGATFVGALLAIVGQKPSNRVLAFALGFAAGIMLLISLMEMLPAALDTQGMSPMLGYGMFIIGLVGYFLLDRMLPHQHAHDLMDAPKAGKTRNLRRTAMLLTLGISLHNFPEGIATFVTASSDLELGMGIALAVAIHNIPEGLAVAGPVYAATGSKTKALWWASISGFAEILGGCWHSSCWDRLSLQYSWHRLWRWWQGLWSRCQSMSLCRWRKKSIRRITRAMAFCAV